MKHLSVQSYKYVVCFLICLSVTACATVKHEKKEVSDETSAVGVVPKARDTKIAYLQGRYQRIVRKAIPLEKKLAKDIENADVFYYTALSFLEMNECDKAKEYLRFLDKYVDDTYNKYEEIQIKLALIEECLGNFDKALAMYEKFVNAYPDSVWLPTAFYNMGVLHQKKGDFKEAQVLFAIINKKYPLSFEAEYLQSTDIYLLNGFVIVIGANYDFNQAREKLKEVKEKGFNADIIKLRKNNTVYYKIGVGQFSIKNDELELFQELKKAGYNPQWFPS